MSPDEKVTEIAEGPTRQGPSVMFLVLAATAVVIALGLTRRLFTAGTGYVTCPPW